MTRISKYKLDSALQEEMFRQFWLTLSLLQNASTASSFFSDLLSETEEIMLAKRFTIAMLLLRGRKPVDIKMILHVSNSMIGTVQGWLKNAQPATRRILVLITKETRWQKLLDQVDGLIDALPPRYGSNWSRVGSEKRQRRIDRNSRQQIQ